MKARALVHAGVLTIIMLGGLGLEGVAAPALAASPPAILVDEAGEIDILDEFIAEGERSRWDSPLLWAICLTIMTICCVPGMRLHVSERWEDGSLAQDETLLDCPETTQIYRVFIRVCGFVIAFIPPDLVAWVRRSIRKFFGK
jgi:hypothetical protein